MNSRGATAGAPSSAGPSANIATWDVATFEESLGRCEDRAYRLAVHLVRDEQTAQGILQATFLSAWQNAHKFADRMQFDVWVYRATVKTSLRHLALRPSRGRCREDASPLPSVMAGRLRGQARAGEGSDWFDGERPEPLSDAPRRRLRRAVDSLRVDLRTVFILCDVEGMSLENVAEILGIPLATVTESLHAARLGVHGVIGSFTRRAGGAKATPNA